MRELEQAAVGPPPAQDPECAAALDMVRGMLPAEITPDTIGSLRALGGAQRTPDEEIERRGYALAERRVPGRGGLPEVTLLICSPPRRDTSAGVVYYLHGGGMIAGTNRTGLGDVLDLAAPEGLAVVSVEYRLAPEHPDPAPRQDAYTGFRWITDHAAELGVDPARILLVGTSAGAGIAAGLALAVRDRGEIAPAGQMLLCPMLDDRSDSVSALQMATLGPWSRTANQTGWTSLLGDEQGGREVSPYASPARAEDLSGLPPTFIDVGSAEVFRDEAVAYASRIWQAGGDAELHVWPGGYHGYDILAPHARISQDTRRARHDWLRRWSAG